MKKGKKQFKIAFIVLLAIFVLLAVWYGALRTGINKYNSTLRSDKTDEGLSISIAPRGGDTDSWSKVLNDGSTLTGTIFEAAVSNTGDCDISDWNERINIKGDCSLNNGWCGTFEIHQFADGEERVQTIDLRNYAADDITLNYKMEGQDLMIDLHEGDYIIYKPSAEVYEMPLSVSASTAVGFILYYDGEAPDFSDTEATFHYNLNYTQSDLYKALIAVFCVWGIAVIVAVSLYIFARRTARELEKREKNLEESIGIFSGFVDAKDTYTNGHSKRVATYAEMIAAAMGYSERECWNVYYIGLMHDCGKCYIPDEILKKPGKLTNEEYALIKSHTTRGGELLKDFKSLENIKEGALYHHERYDGRGYPHGKAGKEIPEIGRILCIADSFDAMNSKRVYRDPLSKEKILQELSDGKGTQFDPDILEVFIKLIEEGKIKFHTGMES